MHKCLRCNFRKNEPNLKEFNECKVTFSNKGIREKFQIDTDVCHEEEKYEIESFVRAMLQIEIIQPLDIFKELMTEKFKLKGKIDAVKLVFGNQEIRIADWLNLLKGKIELPSLQNSMKKMELPDFVEK